MKSLYILLLALLVAICAGKHVSVDVDVNIGAGKQQHTAIHNINNNHNNNNNNIHHEQQIHNVVPTSVEESAVASRTPITSLPQVAIPTPQSAPESEPEAEIDSAESDSTLKLSTLNIIVGGVPQRLVPDFNPSFPYYKVILDSTVPTLRVNAQSSDDVAVILNGQFQHLLNDNQYTSNELRLQPGASSNNMRIRLHNAQETKDYTVMILKINGAKNTPLTTGSTITTPAQQPVPSQSVPATTTTPVSTPTTPSTPATTTPTTTPPTPIVAPKTISLPDNLVLPSKPSPSTTPSHTYNKDCNVRLNGRNYNLKEYVYKHSGGPAGVVNCCGKDCTPFFFQNHSSNYLKLLSSYLA